MLPPAGEELVPDMIPETTPEMAGDAPAEPLMEEAMAEVEAELESDSVPVAPTEVAEEGPPPEAITSTGVDQIPLVPVDESQVIKEDMVTLALTDVPLSDVVTLFMRMSGANIVASPTQLTGRVSVNLKDVPWRSALSQILSMHDLELMESEPGSQIYSISPPRAAAAVPLYTETFQLKYARAETLSNGVSRLIAPNGAILQASGRNLAVHASVAQIEKIRGLVESLDRMIPQVAIEAKFVELNEEAIRNLGLNWSVLRGYTVSAEDPQRAINRLVYTGRNTTTYQEATEEEPASMTPFPVALDSTSSVATRLSSSGTGVDDSSTDTLTRTDTKETHRNVIDQALKSVFTSTVLSADTFALTLSALQENAGVEIVTNPKVVVSSGEKANIHIGQRRPNIVKRTTSTTGGTTDVSYEYGDPEWIEIGTKVGVQPVVNTEENITVNIEPELNRQVGLIEPQPGLTFPILATRKVTSEFVIQSGQTVAIGGLTSTDDRETVKKIPLLGDIPIIGRYLFSHHNTEKVQDETLIFVTVSIANPEDMNAETGIPSHGALIYEKHWNPSSKTIELRNRRLDEFKANLEKAQQEEEESQHIRTAN
ncbi:MAG: hypothetical protein KBA51_00275 [Kiritimatiellae bacterium]|nr:hypothetical protein [Kiritimatiellia bacterium]